MRKVRRVHARVVDRHVVPCRETLVVSAEDGHVYRVSFPASYGGGGARWSLEAVAPPPTRD